MGEKFLPKICRTCLNQSGICQSIFTTDVSTGISIHLAEVLMSFASVQINVGDGLPEDICIDCMRKVIVLYMFKVKCEESDTSLRTRLGKSPLWKPYDVIESVVQDHSFIENDIQIDCDLHDQSIGSFTDACEVTVKDEQQKIDHVQILNAIDVIEKTDPLEITSDPLKDDLLTKTVIRETISDNKMIDINKEKNEFITVNDTGDVYSDHMSTNDKRRYNCELCTKKFSKRSHLTRHMKVHSSERPFACNQCHKRFTRSEQLKHHLNSHDGIKSHVCNICGKGFNQVSNLNDHMRTHSGDKPFLCSTCGKGFNQLGNLRQHTVRHSGIKAHLCSVCGNGFASKGELCAHLRKHTGARPFVCPTCDHAFTTSSSLTKHKRIHSGEKPYECEVCKIRFSRSGILARHRRIHTGEKPYVCTYCTKAFAQSNDLNSHLRIHTGEKPYVCEDCGAAFRQSSALKTHKKNHIENIFLHDYCLNGQIP